MTKFECPHPDCNREFESIASRSGHEAKVHRRWPDKDIEILKKGYENWPDDKLKKELSHRPWSSIISKGEELGLRRKGRAFLNLNLSQYQEDVLHGLLLGDASCRGTEWENGNSDFIIHDNHREFIEHIRQIFPNELFTDNPVREDNGQWVLTTRCCEYMTKKREMFYGTKKREGGAKDIPNIRFSPTVFKYWYIGDGTLGNERENAWKAGIVSTQYLEEKMKEVSQFLANRGMNPNMYEMKDGRTKLEFSNNLEVHKFLSYIGDCPVDCYEYKWRAIHCIKEVN